MNSAARILSNLRWDVRDQSIDGNDYGALNNAYMEVQIRAIMNECNSEGLNITFMGETTCDHFRHASYPSFVRNKTDTHRVRYEYLPAAAMRFDEAFRQSYVAHILNIVVDSFGLKLSTISTELLQPLYKAFHIKPPSADQPLQAQQQDMVPVVRDAWARRLDQDH
ncbi:hypothetical protein CF326_g7073 [Tilletia indica]|nr:hypothetical protein CF326_g7073 [Tilletia indica]